MKEISTWISTLDLQISLIQSGTVYRYGDRQDQIATFELKARTITQATNRFTRVYINVIARFE